MTYDEIRETWGDLSAPEAFEAFEAAGVDNATVADAIGQEVAQEYAHWIYLNLK
jgi:hypothetical protein